MSSAASSGAGDAKASSSGSSAESGSKKASMPRVTCSIHSSDPRKHTDWIVEAFSGDCLGIGENPAVKGQIQAFIKIHGTNLMVENASGGEKPSGFHQVVDVDTEEEASALHAKLIAKHGATQLSPMARAGWGAWMGDVTDPWGVRWTLHAHPSPAGGHCEESQAGQGGSDSAAASGAGGEAGASSASSSPDPSKYQTLVPTVVSPSAKLHGKWVAEATGGKVESIYEGDDGRVMHSDIAVKGAHVYMEDRYLETTEQMNASGPAKEEPLSAEDAARIGPKGWYVMFNLPTEDIKGVYDGMVAKGAKVVDPLRDRFWGAQMGVVRDPFGLDWGLHAFPPSDGTGGDSGTADASSGDAGAEGGKADSGSEDAAAGSKRRRTES